MVARDYFTGGRVPFGYRSEFVRDASSFHSGDKEPPKRLTPDEDTAPIVRRSFELFVETGSVAAVQEYLRSQTPELFWKFDSVKRLLQHDVYRGVLRFGELVNYTAHEAIVSEALWDAAQAAEEKRTRRPKQKPVDEFRFHLRGIVYCPHCDCKMTPVWGHGNGNPVRYYECISSKKKQTVCPVRRVNAVTLHTAVLGEIERAAMHPTYLEGMIRDAIKQLPKDEDVTKRIEGTSRRLREVEKRIKNLTYAVEQGGSEVTFLIERLKALEVERTSLMTASYQDRVCKIKCASS